MRIRVSSGAPWEERVGYSRAVRRGPYVAVSGTTAMRGGKVVAPGDGAAQARHILALIERALQDCGAGLDDVVRTRIFVTEMSRWEAVGEVHGEVFGTIRPATTLVEVEALIHPDLVVEIEVDAWVDDDTAPASG